MSEEELINLLKSKLSIKVDIDYHGFRDYDDVTVKLLLGDEVISTDSFRTHCVV